MTGTPSGLTEITDDGSAIDPFKAVTFNYLPPVIHHFHISLGDFSSGRFLKHTAKNFHHPAVLS